jgi:hypothetical protein
MNIATTVDSPITRECWRWPGAGGSKSIAAASTRSKRARRSASGLASVTLTWPLDTSRSPLRPQVSSTNTWWYCTGMPSWRASAVVMITSDRQLPLRAAKVSAALRVVAASYSRRSWSRRYMASTSAARGPLWRIAAASSTSR